MGKLILIVMACLACSAVPAQTVTGAWYGKADVLMKGNVNNYLTELVIRQKADEIEGVFGYYFKDVYQSFYIHGTYNKKTRQVYIPNLPLLFYGSDTRNGIECPMYFQGTLMVSRVSSTLRGSFYSEPKYKYTCPELRVNMIMDTSAGNQDSLLRNTVAGRRFWQPQEEDVVVNGNAPDTAPLPDSLSPANAERAVTDTNQSLVTAFGKRNNVYEKDIIVHDDSILVSFYDNGDIDDDTISVFLNKKPILVRRGLTSRALNIYIGLDSTIEINELSMFADNLGKYPPNTALMVISDGVRRYELYLSASLKQNASVRLRRARR